MGSGNLVAFQPQADTLTYEPFFGLNEKPFSLNADPRFVHDSPAYAATKEGLLAGIRRREGLLVLTGEIGTGKTTLCRAALRDLGRKTYSSMVPDPFASREDLLKMLLIDFGVMSIEEFTAGRLWQASRTELGYLLSEFLDSLAPDAFAVVIIDEAQNLSMPLIEETRILSDTFGAQGRLQIIFVGQPELHAKLKLPEMRQVDQRVCGYHRLAPMTRDAVAGYIQHRLQVAGGPRDRMLFTPEVVDRLHVRTGGVPRLINRVCDRALHLAYQQQIECVDRETLETALLEVGAATLSPTWDSIIFAEAAPPPAVAATAPAIAAMPPAIAAAPLAVAAMAPAIAVTPAVAPAAPAVRTAPSLKVDDHFQIEIDQWVERDLAATSRTLSSLPRVSADVAPAPRSAAKTAPRREVPARNPSTAWLRDLQSETKMDRRAWPKRAAIALAVLLAVSTAFVGALLLMAQTQPTFAAFPAAPAKALPGIEAPEAPLPDTPRPEALLPEASRGAVSVPGDYLVVVGLFSSREHADQLVDVLTQAGLPAMQRPFQLRQQEVQQIVLGPFFNRSDAAADLQRLQSLGGYDDASVIAQ